MLFPRSSSLYSLNGSTAPGSAHEVSDCLSLGGWIKPVALPNRACRGGHADVVAASPVDRRDRGRGPQTDRIDLFVLTDRAQSARCRDRPHLGGHTEIVVGVVEVQRCSGDLGELEHRLGVAVGVSGSAVIDGRLCGEQVGVTGQGPISDLVVQRGCVRVSLVRDG